MRNPNEAALDSLKVAAREVNRLMALQKGVISETEFIERCLLVGDMVGALKANERVNAEALKMAQVQFAISMCLGAVEAADPEFWKATMDHLRREALEKSRNEFAQRIEDWPIDQLREALAKHLDECEEHECAVLAALEERLARHEPH